MSSKLTETARRALLVPALCALSFSSVCIAPADAQNWNYNPFTGGATWTGAANLLMYPFNRYSSTTAPLYLSSPLIWGGAYYVNQSLTNGARRFTYGNYTADDGLNSHRQRTRPLLSDGNGAMDQIAHAQPHNAGSNTSQTVPPPAPPFYRPPLTAQSMAAGFVDLVNTKFDGNISKALFDPAARSYARAVGLLGSDDIFDADLSEQKIATIKSIFADQSEDPAARINAARLLLKH